jgi:hypothetical protein
VTLKTKDIVEKFADLPDDQRQGLVADALAATAGLKWLPLPGPQTQCYFSEADILLYGGEAGGSKTDTGLGLAFTAHRHSLLCRRQYTDMGAMIERALQINGSRVGFNGAPPAKLRTPDGRVLEFFAAHQPGDEQRRQGQPVDLLFIDEAAQWLWSQIQLMMGWVRSTDPSQPCRTVLASNPPLSSEGVWMVEEFAPWLDPTHPHPAKPGELRWFVSDEHGKSLEVSGPEEIEVGGHIVKPQSRTFIPAGLKDNPFLSRTAYKDRLDNLPEPLRSAIRDGDFTAMREDDLAQIMPRAWVDAAQQRWQPVPPPGVPMCAVGVDVAAGGPDDTVLACRHDGYFPELIEVSGRDTPLGADVAALVVRHRRNNAQVTLDMGGGYGGAAYERLLDNGITAYKFKGSEKASGRTRDGSLRFVNKRTEAYWRLREAMDPDQPGGSPIMLPPDQKLAAQLCSVRFTMTPHGIAAEDKISVVKRLGRSPDKADAVVMCWYKGVTGGHQRQIWNVPDSGGRPFPKVIRGYESKKKRWCR